MKPCLYCDGTGVCSAGDCPRCHGKGLDPFFNCPGCGRQRMVINYGVKCAKCGMEKNNEHRTR